jgi:Holliday junction resolvase-like predicted endonuclease
MRRKARRRRSPPEPVGSRAGLAHGGPAADLGQLGEAIAARALAGLGLRCVARNLRVRGCEIDLLVRRRRLWVAVEVKARGQHPAPERLVDDARLARLAAALTGLAPALRPRPRRLRVDVVAVRALDHGFEVRHFAGAAFDPPGRA